MLYAALFDDDMPRHARLSVARNKAREFKLTCLGELPDDLAGLPWRKTDRVWIVVLHVRVLLHELGVFEVFSGRGEHEFMSDGTAIPNHEFDLLAFLDVQFVRNEPHVSVGILHGD